ncbi:MAG: hypothetical protein AAFP22_07540 [Planctomycetota bacterium]
MPRSPDRVTAEGLQVFHEALHRADVTSDELHDAVVTVTSSDSWYPAPARLIELVVRGRAETVRAAEGIERRRQREARRIERSVGRGTNLLQWWRHYRETGQHPKPGQADAGGVEP